MEPDTTVRCRTCGATRSVSLLASLHEWPRCCDHAMKLERTSVAIEVAVAKLWATKALRSPSVQGMLDRIAMRAN